MSNFELTQEEIAITFNRMITEEYLKDKSPLPQKRATLLYGQPGSGKSALASEILKQELNTVFINGDDLRTFHPKYAEYAKENDKLAADMTQEVTNIWIEMLLDECIRRNLSFVIEGTFRKLSVPTRTATLSKENAYETELAIISAPKAVSLRSILMRYEDAKELGQHARYTSEGSHDEAYENIEPNLEALTEGKLIDKYTIYKRENECFERKEFPPEMRDQILEEFKLGRNREVTEDELELLNCPREFRKELRII